MLSTMHSVQFCISSFGESSRSIIVYANHSPYSESENIFQIRDVFITGGSHHILDIQDVTEVHHLIVWCWCIFRTGMWQVQSVWARIGNVAVTVHECTGVYLELDLPTKWHHPVELWENLLLP